LTDALARPLGTATPTTTLGCRPVTPSIGEAGDVSIGDLQVKDDRGRDAHY
jgi:hypothetical protein